MQLKRTLAAVMPFAGLVGFVLYGTLHTPAVAEAVPAVSLPRQQGADLTGVWKVDTAHTDIGFSVTHLGVSRTRGRFNDFDGTLNVDGANPERSSVEVNIKVASVDTGNQKRDEHLRGKDFFDADTYPNMTYKSTSIKKAKNGEYISYGNLTIKNVTRPVALRFKPTKPVKGPGGQLHAGMSTDLTINRKEYGLTWNGIVEGVQAVGDEVKITIDMEAIKQ